MTRQYFFLALWTFVVGGFVTGLIVVCGVLTVRHLVRRSANELARRAGDGRVDSSSHRFLRLLDEPQPI
jgi:hypothetical protein